MLQGHKFVKHTTNRPETDSACVCVLHICIWEKECNLLYSNNFCMWLPTRHLILNCILRAWEPLGSCSRVFPWMLKPGLLCPSVSLRYQSLLFWSCCASRIYFWKQESVFRDENNCFSFLFSQQWRINEATGKPRTLSLSPDVTLACKAKSKLSMRQPFLSTRSEGDAREMLRVVKVKVSHLTKHTGTSQNITQTEQVLWIMFFVAHLLCMYCTASRSWMSHSITIPSGNVFPCFLYWTILWSKSPPWNANWRLSSGKLVTSK